MMAYFTSTCSEARARLLSQDTWDTSIHLLRDSQRRYHALKGPWGTWAISDALRCHANQLNHVTTRSRSATHLELQRRLTVAWLIVQVTLCFHSIMNPAGSGRLCSAAYLRPRVVACLTLALKRGVLWLQGRAARPRTACLETRRHSSSKVPRHCDRTRT
jgi:hypothetical protein